MNRLTQKILFCFLLFICLWLAGLSWFVRQIPLQHSTYLTSADAIVVLTGDSGRLEHGLQLLSEKKGKVLFISGVSKKTTLRDLLHYAAPAIEKKASSLPIILGHEAENTIGNARETAAWLRKEGHKIIYVVTSNYHMPRSLAELREAAPDLHFVQEPVFPEDFTLSRWWQDKYSRSMVMLEYHKLLASKFRHWFVLLYKRL